MNTRATAADADVIGGDHDPAGDANSAGGGYCSSTRQSNRPYANSFESGIDGSNDETAFTLCSPLHLAALTDNPDDWGLWFRLEADLDVRGLPPTDVIIGAAGTPFHGVFDGDGHVITGLYFDDVSASTVGLFAEAANATIARLRLASVNITAADYVGGLVGASNGVLMVSNVSVSGTLVGDSSVGGLVGLQGDSGGIRDCTFSGSITGDSIIGGIVGESNGGDIINCHSGGSIDATGGNVGGIGGGLWVSGFEIRGCSSNMSIGGVLSDGEAGGIVGRSWISVIDCAATARSISSDGWVGGLAGEIAFPAEVVDSYSITDVDGRAGQNVGGLIGWGNTARVVRSYAAGDVIGGSDVGGLIGRHQRGTITDSFALGAVSGNDTANDVGKLFGSQGTSDAVSGTFASGAAACVNSGGGNCNAIGPEKDTVAVPTYFEDPTNEPMSRWDFGAVWQRGADGLPILR